MLIKPVILGLAAIMNLIEVDPNGWTDKLIP